MGWLRLALRRVADDRASTLGLALLVLATALAAAAAPRVLAGLADTAIRAQLAGETAAMRNLALIQQRRIAAGPDADPLAVIRAMGADLEATIPTRIRALTAGRGIVVESGRYRIGKPTTDPAFVRLRIQEGVEPHLRYIAGRPPTAAVETRDDVGPEAVDRVPVYESAVSALTAERFGLALDEVVPLIGDPGDALIGRTPFDVYAFARITGIYDVADPDAEFWLDDPALIRPVVRALSAEIQLLDAALLVDPATYGPLLDVARSLERPLRYTWRLFLDTDRLTGLAVPALIVDARRLKVAYPSANVTPANDTALRTGLLATLEGHQQRWTAAESLTAVVALGPALVVIATLGLIALLSARRRAATLALARSRGASAGQVLMPALAEGVAIALPATLVAAVVAVAVVPTGRLSLTFAAAALVAVVAAGAVVATVVPVARALGPARRPGDRIVAGARGRRLVAEALVVGLAVAGALLLRERGVATSGSTGTIRGFDPLIAAVPALAGVAAGLAAVRIYPLVMRAVARIGRRGRGLVPLLAARRATEGGPSGAVLLVLLATATVGSFTAVALDQLDRGADLAAWEEIGAAYRIAPPSGGLPSTFDPGAIPAADAVATVFRATVPVNLTGPQVVLTIADAGALAEVLRGTPIDPAFPAGFATPAAGPLPVIVSRSLVDNPQGVAEDEVFTLSVEGYSLEYRVVDVRESFPGIPAGRHFAVVAREAFRAAAPPARIVPGLALVRAPAAAGDAIRAAVTAMSPSLQVSSQTDDAASRRGAPVTAAVRALMLAGILVTAGYAALGVAAALTLSGLARSVEVAQLRTLGLRRRESYLLVFAEHGPATLAAFAAGGALGVGLFGLLRTPMNLASLSGATVEVPIVLEAGPLLLILAAMTIVVSSGLLLGAALQRRVAPTDVLRGQSE